MDKERTSKETKVEMGKIIKFPMDKVIRRKREEGPKHAALLRRGLESGAEREGRWRIQRTRVRSSRKGRRAQAPGPPRRLQRGPDRQNEPLPVHHAHA